MDGCILDVTLGAWRGCNHWEGRYHQVGSDQDESQRGQPMSIEVGGSHFEVWDV